MQMEVPRQNVLFLHGLWMNGLETWWLRQRVAAHGFETHSVSYPTMHSTAEEVAQRLACIKPRQRRADIRHKGRAAPRRQRSVAARLLWAYYAAVKDARSGVPL